MEYYSGENGFLEELIALRSEPLEALLPMAAMSEFYCSNNNGWSFDSCSSNSLGADNSIAIPLSNYGANNNNNDAPAFEDYSFQIDQSSLIVNSSSTFGELYTPSFAAGGELLSPPEFTDSSNNQILDETPPFLPCHHHHQEDYSLSSIVESEDQHQVLVENVLHSCCLDTDEMGEAAVPCKVEPTIMQSPPPPPPPAAAEEAQHLMPTSLFNMGISNSERKNKSKKLNGQPSKNLMAERRRRKRLNDRLSMLRSVVPKISKMDRTSILGDTIDYMKELLERINRLQEEMEEEGSEDHLSFMNVFKDIVKPNEVSVRNSPKFDVERRRNMDARMEICCAGKPGLLLSTVTTLEALGLEIQQCVISCFNEFSMQASCSEYEDGEQRGAITPEDIKQALFRNAGYGGRCL